MGADPIAVGLIANLNQPGANLTGVTSLNVGVGPKRLESEIVPTAAAFAVLINPPVRLPIPRLVSIPHALSRARSQVTFRFSKSQNWSDSSNSKAMSITFPPA